MSAPTLVRSFVGDRDHSSFGFAVKHMTVSTFRGTFEDVDATVQLTEDGAIVVSGSAAVESIGVRSPVDLRTHLLSADFFDAEQHRGSRSRPRPRDRRRTARSRSRVSSRSAT